MCLELTKGKEKALVAKEDIKCYKVLEWNEARQKWVSPMFKTDYEPNKPVSADGKVEKWKYFNHYELLGGALHTFARLEDALNQVDFYDWFFIGYSISRGMPRRIIAECIIPRGTKYYEGTFYSPVKEGGQWTRAWVPSYASKKLFVTDKVYEVKLEENN